ncbi:hypothetical protein K1T71_004957 [Dendrolimus kikuchii]|uniref:Uncharacterized protein n=1 Tax=Dendrolimus kikuchii TaxID=765133 RepID=A0ACC1D604_9NEOP|nr:hypothetical protein K1T71_004957 [Dendrolimus kikuchii]
MSDNKNIDSPLERSQLQVGDSKLPESSDASSIAGNVNTKKISSSSERLIKFERAQKCLENAVLVSKRIKEHRKATAELLGRPFEEDEGDTASEMASTMSERTGYSAATDVSTTLSVQDALNIPGISESLANTLKQKELLMERIKHYKEISKRPAKSLTPRKEVKIEPKLETKKNIDNLEVGKLTNTIKDKENAISVMQVKMKALETTILDLQEKINEKDQIIEAKNMATTLMSDTLSKKEKDSLALLEDTKQQMTKMQENFVNMEVEWREEKQRLLKDVEAKDTKISFLEEANSVLEKSRFELSEAHSEILKDLQLKNDEIKNLHEKIETLSQTNIETLSQKEKEDVEEEKGSLEIAGMAELTKKIELLEQLNCQIRQTNKELENKLSSMTEQKPSGGSPSKKGSPMPTRKGARGTASKMKSPWTQLSSESLPQETDKKQMKNEIARLEMLVQSLNKDILDKEYVISQKDELISNLQCAHIKKEEIFINKIDIGVSTTSIEDLVMSKPAKENEKDIDDTEEDRSNESKPEDIESLQDKLRAAEEQIAQLNEDIDSANKNMIKVKSNNKIKLKQMQKTIDSFSKMSDANTEIVRLNDELHQLSQKVAELEEEKGNLQLHLVDYDSGRLTDSDIYKKMVEMENLAEARLRSISILETQKFDLVQELHNLQVKYTEIEDKLADITQLQNDQVCSEIKSVQLEEQIDELTASRKQLELVIENLKLDKEQLNGNIKLVEQEKEDLIHKLESYIQENMELTDKLEKLSAEKVSSAESIEIVESLTTQEKLELEEYNKGIGEDKNDGRQTETSSPTSEHNLENLLEQTAELNNKIKLFEQERQEVMIKMGKLNSENETLHQQINELNNHCTSLQNCIEMFSKEKVELEQLNHDLKQQIEDLKRERIEILKESTENAKPTEELVVVECGALETQNEEKPGGDRGGPARTKSVKQLTKEILKLKNTIKEREAEIADCQMKILSLEEQEQKKNNLLQNTASYEAKIKCLVDENIQLKENLDILKSNKEVEQQLVQYKTAHDVLQQEIQKIHQEYSATINVRDARIAELEKLLQDYEDRLLNYSNTLQQKDKDMSEYVNQITKLNDVSQKLKSTIELLEEEKAKDQNAELVKSLNKQIIVYQKKLNENEEKLRILEDEKAHLLTLKSTLESNRTTLDIELKKLQETFSEKQSLIKELQVEKQRHKEELSSVILQTKERDEEIHEIKLQLRKESIENEKLRDNLTEKEKDLQDLTQHIEEIKATLDKGDSKEILDRITNEKDLLTEQITYSENKNKELMEKFKKLAVNFKKKSSMYTELETSLYETQKLLENKNSQLDQLLIQVETLPALQEKLKHAEEEINRLQSYKVALDQQKSQDINQLQANIQELQIKLTNSYEQATTLTKTIDGLRNDLNAAHEENTLLKTQLELLNKKIAELEIEQKNNMNVVTKVTGLEAEINQKQNELTDLKSKLENSEELRTQTQFGYEAKLQERDLYIENLETEMSKYKNRICRLEESISAMEDRRVSLERKADQLGNYLQEKQKAYAEYTQQEDELINRLAVLMDHDRVVEKQLYEIESENKELQNKVLFVSDENQRLKLALNDMQEHCIKLVDKAGRTDVVEAEISKYQAQLHELDSQLKKISHDHQVLLLQKKHEIEELKSEFNTQIENSIKEKKILSEKYEKVIEHVSQLEQKVHDYKLNIHNLTVNIEELSRINYELNMKGSNTKVVAPDYTEQYVSEINNLNSILNSKNEELSALNNKIETQQLNTVTLTSDFESKILDLNSRLNKSSIEIERLVNEKSVLQHKNDELQKVVVQKEDQLKELMEKQKLTFEMNIPKTEGMVISSTIEALNDDAKELDLTALESQIVSDVDIVEANINYKKISDNLQKQTMDQIDSKSGVQEVIVPKKSYLCYKSDESVQNIADPFNSDEGWGLGESEDTIEVSSDYSYLHEQIHRLKGENEDLRQELDLNKSKLLKALKKLKELKSSNDILTNELNTAKQLSQSSFLDSAIEDELKFNIQELEKKVSEVTADLTKEKREKDSIKKQNEVFNSANDRLTEIKEKLENEIELWKFKFKEANDKLSTVRWEKDSQDSPQRTSQDSSPNRSESHYKIEISKLEKENDELQSMIDLLTAQNTELQEQQSQYKNEISNLNIKLQQSNLNSNMEQIKAELLQANELLSNKLSNIEEQYTKLKQEYNHLKADTERKIDEVESEKKLLETQSYDLQKDLNDLQVSYTENITKVSTLISELNAAKEKLILYEENQKSSQEQHSDSLLQLNSLTENCEKLKDELQAATAKISHLEETNEQIVKRSCGYEERVSELNTKIENLNKENDQLLSNLAELRSTLSTAVDQRGLEIAELWKQHLAQREADFQKMEHELRQQINAAETKYEHLLDNVQSSTQEETNKLIMMEQVSSLQNKLQDKEEHVQNLQNRCGDLMQQIDMLRSEMEDEKVAHDNKLLEQQEEYEKMLQELISKNQNELDTCHQALTNTQNELVASKTSADELIKQNADLQNKLIEADARISDLTTQLTIKNNEIYQKTHEYSVAIGHRNEEFETVRQQLLEYEKKVDDISYEKESELAILRLKLHEVENRSDTLRKELESEKSNLIEALNEKITECTNFSRQIVELNQALEDHSKKSTEMQTALESQEIEIVSLNDEITNLQNMLRTSNSKIQKHVSFASDTKPGDSEGDNSGLLLNKELLDAVPRAELDLALYMLHQRDVRCEELTMELTQLLEERDTLQLRLSDSLRSNEDLKAKVKSSGLDDLVESSSETISDLPSFNVEREQHFVDTHRGQTSRNSSISDPDGDKPKLQAKLSELRGVRHSRDVRLRQESEQRQMELRLLQSDVANLPSEAVEQLAQAHHTLSRDSQSTSTVLLNWLRGKSTPKVVHM